MKTRCQMVSAILIIATSLDAQAIEQRWNAADANNIWNLENANWEGGTVWTNGNSAVFGGSGETVEVGAALTVSSMTFEVDGYAVADADNDGALEMTGAPTLISVADHCTAKISESLTGAGGVSKTGGGHLIVNNAFTGALDVQSGYLSLLHALGGTMSVGAGAGVAFEQGADLASALGHSANQFAAGAMVGIYAPAHVVTNPAMDAINFGDQRFLKLGNGTLLIQRPLRSLASVTAGIEVVEGILFIREGTTTSDYMIPAGTPIRVHDGATLHISLQQQAEYDFEKPLFLSGNYSSDSAVKGALYIYRDAITINLNAPITLLDATKIKAYSSISTVNFNAPIIGSGNLIIGGGGAGPAHQQTLNFNVASTFDGDVILQNENTCNAFFNWHVDNALPATAILSVGGNETARTTELDLRGFTQQTAGVADAPRKISIVRDFVNSAETPATLELNVAADHDLSFTGKFRDTINVVKRGIGIQRLLGDGSDWNGTLFIEEGVVWIGSNTVVNTDVRVFDGGQIIPLDTNVNVRHVTLSGLGNAVGRGALLFENDKHDTWNGDITIDGYARIGAYTGGIMSKTINGVIAGSGTLNIWAGGGALNHENVYVITKPATFKGAVVLDASSGASLTLKLSGADNILPDAVPVRFNASWSQAFCRLDLMGTSAQRVGALISAGKAVQCRAVVNSVADTTSTLTINTLGGTAKFEGVIGESGICVSPGAVDLVKEGPGAQIFIKGSPFTWIDNTSVGTNVVNANVIVNNGALGLSGTDILSADKTVTVHAGGALLAPNQATLDALRADARFTIHAASPVGLYDAWDVTAADSDRAFYYSGHALIDTDNSAALPNGLILAGGVVRMGLTGAAGDSVFGPVDAPLILNGTTIKNNSNAPVLSADRTITVNQGGVAFEAGGSQTLSVLSRLTGSGPVNINCDNGTVILANTANDYSGGTVVGVQWEGYTGNAATLKLGAPEVIPHGAGKGDLSLENSAVLDLNGFDETVNGFNSQSASVLITNSAAPVATLTVGADDADGSYSGAIGGLVALVKIGAGTQILAGVCGSLADTVIEGGTLALVGNCSVASKKLLVKRGGTLELSHAAVFGGSASQTRLYAGIDTSTQGEQAKIKIPAGVTVTVLHFAIDGVFKTAGTWGATGSGADNIDDTVFTGGGMLTVLETGPAGGTCLSVR